MKIIDEKGRFFGRINVIDLLVLIGVLLVAVFLVGKILGGGNNNGLGGSTKLVYTVKVNDVDADVYKALQEISFPDQLMAAGDMLNGNVTAMNAVSSKGQVYQVSPDTQGGMSLSTGAKDTYDITFTIEAFVANGVKNELGTQEIRVGKPHIVKTKQFELEKGVITSCQREENPQ